MSIRVSIKKTYPSFTLAIDLTAESETVGLLGASGCGKSLTLRSIAGIETPDEGVIEVNGKTFFDRAAGKKARVDLSPQERKTALLFQNYQLFPNLTVEDNIGAGIAPSNTKDARASLVKKEIERFGLTGLEKRYPVQLSGGQQQRVALARMLAADPAILMLDEPFSALDSHLKGMLEQNLAGLFKEFGGTILYVSHDIDEALRLCDRIAVVDNGTIIEDGPARNLIDHPGSLAALKLSGCKNTTPARYVDEHLIQLPDWGITLETADRVPKDVAYAGIRAFMIEKANGPGRNHLRVRASRVTEARFDRTVIVDFIDREERMRTDDAETHHDDMRYLKERAYWRINTLSTPANNLPSEGDELWIRIPPDKIYLATR